MRRWEVNIAFEIAPGDELRGEACITVRRAHHFRIHACDLGKSGKRYGAYRER